MTVDELQVLITANTNELRKEMGKANKNISNLQKSASKSTAGISSAFIKLKKVIVALGIGKVIKDSIQSGMDAIESDSLFETVMGDNAAAVKSWSNGIADALGLNAVAMQKNIGVIYNMTSSMGVAGDNALKMSKGVSVLAEDMASFYNLDSAEAFNKLRAGLTGETEPLKALGILVDENTVKQVAYSEGIAQNGAELTNQQKVLARYVAILRQTGNAQGDLARTLNSPANQLRSLKQNVTNLGIAFSKILMPIVQAVLPWLNALAKVATNALNSLASLLGANVGGAGEETKKISDNAGSIGGGLDDASKKAKKLKQSLAGFDEMNVLSDNSEESDSGGGAAAAATVGLDFDLSEYNAHLDWAESSAGDLVSKIEGFFSSLGEGISFDNLSTAFSNLKTSVEGITSNLWDGLKWAMDNVLKPLAEWTIEKVIPEFFDLLSGAFDILNQAIEDVKPIFQWLWDNVLSPIAEWTGGVIVDVLNGLGNALKWIADNEVAMAIIEGVAIAIGLVSAALGIWNAITALSIPLGTALGSVIAFITSPVTLVTLAIGALIAIIILCVKNWDKIKEVAAKCWEGIKNVWNTVSNWIKVHVVDPIKNFFVGLWDGIKNVWNAVKTWFSNVFTGAWNGIKSAWSAVKTWFSNLWTGIKNVFSKVGEWFSNIFSKAWSGIKAIWSAVKTWFSNLWSGIKNVFSKVGTWFSDKFTSAWTGIKNAWSAVKTWFSNLWQGIKNVFSSVGTWFGNIFSKAWTGIKSAWNAVKTWFSNLWQGIKNVFSNVATWFSNIFSKAWTGIKSAWNAVKTWFSNLWTGIKNVWNAVKTWFSNIFTGAWNGIKSAWSAVKTWFSNLWQGIKNVFNSVSTWFSNIFSKAWTGIKNAFSNVKSFFTGIWDSIKAIFSKVGTAIADAVGGTVKKAINAVLSTAVSIINGFITAINFAIGIINKIPGVEINKLTKLEVPKMARGGVVDRPTYAMIGEAGAEAVVPLERNLGYLDKLAGMLAEKMGGGNGSINLTVKLGEDTIFDKFIEYGRAKAFETNGEVVFA